MNSNTLDFITSKALRKNMVESIEFAAWLWIFAQEIENKYKDEMFRTIILYNISIVEALLLFRAKRIKIKFFKYDYKESAELPKTFHPAGRQVFVTFRDKTTRNESQVWFYELIKEQKDFLDTTLHKQVVDLQDIRNTFHLSRPRSILSPEKVDESFAVVLKIINKIRKEIRKAQ